MEKSWYKIFNYSTIAIAFILAGLLLIDMVRGSYDIIPRSYYYPILIVVGLIFILRIVIRYYLIQNSKKQTN